MEFLMNDFVKTEQMASILKALGNVKRLEIMHILCHGEKKVGELEKDVRISQSALSQHLAVLRTAGLVSTRRNAQSVYYSIADIKCRNLLDFLNKNYPQEA